MNGLAERLQRGWYSCGLCLLAGVLLTASFAPFSLWPLAPASILVLLWQIEGQAPGPAALRGWLYGVGLFGSGASWVYVSIHVYGHAGVGLAATLTALFCLALAILCLIPCWLHSRLPGDSGLRFAALWVLTEWFRSWFLTGFPWLITGTSQVDGPLAGWLPLVGVYGVSLLLATGAVVALRLAQRRLSPAAGVIALSILLFSGPLLSRIAWTEAEGNPVEVALVQGNVDQDIKWVPETLRNTMALYESLSGPHWGSDILVWPEAAIPALMRRVTSFLETLDAQAQGAGSSLLLGIPVADKVGDQWRVHNSVLAIGNASGVYHKQRLVPFGEYVPLEDLLGGLLRFFELPMSAMHAGQPGQRSLHVQGHQVGTFICYEIVYPDLVAAGSRDATLLLTVSNDTWFGASIGPLQHLQMARARALETGKPLLRATNNGVSALIDHRGAMLVRGRQFTREVITGKVQPMQGATPFARTQSWPVLVLCALALFVPTSIARRGNSA